MTDRNSRRKFIGGALGTAALMSVPLVARATPKKYDAIVVGAGLSGLHAAMLLEESGMNVLVLEGRKRLGGRVYTLMDIPGKPEAAGELIGGNYARMISTAQQLKLDLVNPPAQDISRDWQYGLKGQFFSKEDWVKHPLNPMTGDDRKILPHRMLFTLTNQNNPLAGKALDAWLTPEFQKYDIPFDQYLRKRGFKEDVIKMMDITIHTSSVEQTSALHELRRYHVGTFNGNRGFPDGARAKKIKGGNSILPEKMAASLQHQPLIGKTVVHFEQTNSTVTVYCADGTSYQAGHVVCSIPMAVLRDITFSPKMPPHLQNAIREIDYGESLQAHYAIKKKYWEEDGMDPSMWTDTFIERFALRGPSNADGVQGAVAFINGDAANKFRLMNDRQVLDYVENQLASIRPSMAGALEPLLVQSCERDPHGAGDWVYWQPGQITKYGNNMRDPHGRIHFCGEHTAINERGMEGAFESGERAALDIILS